MSRKKSNLKLTDREMDVLNIFWSADKPLVASDITKIDDSISINTVQAVLRNLLSKNLVEVADIVYSGTVLTRSYRPTINSNDFSLQQLVNQIENLKKTISTPSIVATLLEHEKNEEAIIEELEKMLCERKKLLKGGD